MLQDWVHVMQKIPAERSGMTYTMDTRWKEKGKKAKNCKKNPDKPELWLLLGWEFARSGLLPPSFTALRETGRLRAGAMLPPSLFHFFFITASHRCVSPGTDSAAQPGRSALVTVRSVCAGRGTDGQQLRIMDITSPRVTSSLTDKTHRGGCELYRRCDLSCQLSPRSNFLLSQHNCWLATAHT